MQFKPADDWSGTTAFEFKVTDSGGADSGSQFILITVDAVNDAPVVDLNGTNDAGTDFAATFTEGGGAVLVADTDAILGDVDSATFNSLSVNFLVASDGASEKLTIAGYTFSHGVGDVVTRTVGSTTFEIDCDGTGIQHRPSWRRCRPAGGFAGPDTWYQLREYRAGSDVRRSHDRVRRR